MTPTSSTPGAGRWLLKTAVSGSRFCRRQAPVESLEKVKNGEAKLAVTRTDVAKSERARAVALLHSDPVVIVAPEKAKIENFGS